MERVRLEVQLRTEAGSRAVRRMRKQGIIPGVLYGHGGAAHLLGVEERVLRDAVTGGAGMHSVMDLTFEGQKTTHTAVIKEYQLDPVKHFITHVDFHEVKLSEPIEAKVAVAYEGQSPGLKLGGVLDILVRDVTVRALPTNIPDHVVLDTSQIDLGGAAHVRDITVPDDVEVLDDPDETACTVLVPRKIEVEEEVEEAAEEAAAEAQEPELIGRKGEGEES